jgi:CheY-like chemotaxis protein
VEDSLIIAMDVEAIVSGLGARIVFTASGLRQARDQIAENAVDFAILDINLGSETSLPIADELRQRSIPFVFASGYGDQAKLQGDYASAYVITKPYGREEILEAWRVTVHNDRD